MAAFTPVKVLLADFFFVCRRLKAYPVVTLSILLTIGKPRVVISHLGVAIAGRQSYWWRCWHQPRFIYESSISIWHPMGTTIVIAIPASSFSQNRIYIDLGVGSKTNFKGLQMSLFLAAFAICKLFIYFLNDHSNFIYFYISYRLVFRLNKKGFWLYEVHCYEGGQERKHHHDWRPVVSCSVWGSSRYI